MTMLSNRYSPEWFDLFASTAPPDQTEREVAFVDSVIAPAARVLDLACGLGRHAVPLRSRGHRVVGLDGDYTALRAARQRTPEIGWVQADMRDIPFRPGSFDAVVSLWQSFGYFDAETNAAVLRQTRDLLRRDGILVIDLYHREFFEQHQGERRSERQGTTVVERKRVRDGRLHLNLAYEQTGGGDEFDWQLFSPEEFSTFARRCGLRVRAACSRFDLNSEPTARLPRVQYVLGVA